MLSEKFYQDYERLTGQKWNLLRGGVKLTTTLGLRFIFWGRISARCRNRFSRILFQAIMHHYKEKHNLMIPFGSTGGGLALGYPHDIIVNGGVTLGEQVCLFKGVLIGSVRSGAKAGVPTIGDRVVIGQNRKWVNHSEHQGWIGKLLRGGASLKMQRLEDIAALERM